MSVGRALKSHQPHAPAATAAGDAAAAAAAAAAATAAETTQAVAWKLVEASVVPPVQTVRGPEPSVDGTAAAESATESATDTERSTTNAQHLRLVAFGCVATALLAAAESARGTEESEVSAARKACLLVCVSGLLLLWGFYTRTPPPRPPPPPLHLDDAPFAAADGSSSKGSNSRRGEISEQKSAPLSVQMHFLQFVHFVGAHAQVQFLQFVQSVGASAGSIFSTADSGATVDRTRAPSSHGSSAANIMAAAESKVACVSIRAGDFVDCITITKADGSSIDHGDVYGGSGCPTFRLAPTEYLTKVIGRQGNHLDAVRFVTSTGRSSAWFGGPGGDEIEYEAEAGHMITGINRPAEWCAILHGITTAHAPTDLE